MNFIHKLLMGKMDDGVRRNFLRFGKGLYKYRAMALVKKSKSGVKLNTTFEYSNDFVQLFAEESKTPVTISGTIVTTHDLNTLGVAGTFTKRMGVGKFEIPETALSAKDLHSFFEKVQTNFLILNLSSDLGSVVCKQKLPNPKKSPKLTEDGKEEVPKIDFCKCSFSNLAIAEDFFFDVKGDYTQAQVMHAFMIDSLEVPEKYKNDLALARLHVIHKGKTVRVLTVDGKESTKEYPLAV